MEGERHAVVELLARPLLAPVVLRLERHHVEPRLPRARGGARVWGGLGWGVGRREGVCARVWSCSTVEQGL